MKILLIEDDPGIIEIVTIILRLRWSEAALISTVYGEKGIELAQTESPDVIILDLGLPDIDGFQVLSNIRATSDVPVIILTVRGEEMSKVKGLEMGADDYMIKPFSPVELLARMKAVTRRTKTDEAAEAVTIKPFIQGSFRIDFASGEVSVGDKPLKLSPREFDLLHYLVANAGTVVPNEVLLEKIFGSDETHNAEYLDLLIRRLKDQIETAAGNPTMIVNVDDMGYKFLSP